MIHPVVDINFVIPRNQPCNARQVTRSSFKPVNNIIPPRKSLLDRFLHLQLSNETIYPGDLQVSIRPNIFACTEVLEVGDSLLDMGLLILGALPELRELCKDGLRAFERREEEGKRMDGHRGGEDVDCGHECIAGEW